MAVMRGSVVALIGVLTMLPLRAQPVPGPSFDVASIKPNQSGDQGTSSFVQPGGRYTATNATLRMLMRTAFGVHDDQIAGGPRWTDSERYDIVAKVDGNPPTSIFRDQARLMPSAASG